MIFFHWKAVFYGYGGRTVCTLDVQKAKPSSQKQVTQASQVPKVEKPSRPLGNSSILSRFQALVHKSLLRRCLAT